MSVQKSWLSWSKPESYFSPFVDQCSPSLLCTQRSDCSFQRLFRSTISCSRPEIFAIESRIPKFWCFWAAKFFGEEPPNFWRNLKKTTVTTEHVAKFGDDQPRVLRDYTAKKMIETTAAFLACDSIYAIARYMPSPVRPSVRLSVTRVDQSKTVEVKITQPSPQTSPMTLVFWCLTSPWNSKGTIGSGGAE